MNPPMAFLTEWTNLLNKCHPSNSNLGMVITLHGPALDFANNKRIDLLTFVTTIKYPKTEYAQKKTITESMELDSHDFIVIYALEYSSRNQ